MIKIELSRVQFSKLLVESDLFRSIVSERFEAQNKADCSLDFWTSWVRKTFPELNDKIGAIKWIREQTAKNFQALELFDRNGFPYDKEHMILGLMSAKKFVESCF